MDSTLPSLIMLIALILPIILFISRISDRSAASYVHSVLMGGLCFAMGILISAAYISLAAPDSELWIALVILAGSLGSAVIRLFWVKRFS